MVDVVEYDVVNVVLPEVYSELNGHTVVYVEVMSFTVVMVSIGELLDERDGV